MNAEIFQFIGELMRDRGIDSFAHPALPPLDMGEDAVRDACRALTDLATALGLELAFSEHVPLFKARTNTQIELQLLNLQLATFRAMIMLGYDFDRLEAAMRRMLENQPESALPSSVLP